MFVETAVKRDVKAFTEKANEVISTRIDGIVAEMRKVIGSKLFSEEVINELSSKTLHSYTQKAMQDHGYLNTVRKYATGKQKSNAERSFKNRRKGIATAYDKLDAKNEDEDVNEIKYSGVELGRYDTKYKTGDNNANGEVNIDGVPVKGKTKTGKSKVIRTAKEIQALRLSRKK